MMSLVRKKKDSKQITNTPSRRTLSKIEQASLIVRELAAEDYSDPMAFVLLELLDNKGQALLSDVGDTFDAKGWSRKTLTRHVKYLELLILVERTDQAMEVVNDLRKKIIRLTHLGLEVVTSLEDAFRQRPFGPLKRGPNLSKKMREALDKMRQYQNHRDDMSNT